jgi:hypothetical protein
VYWSIARGVVVTRKSCDEAGCTTYVSYGCVKFGQLIGAAGGQAERRTDLEVDSFHE